MVSLWCAFLAILCLEATALITPEQKKGMLCTDTCTLLIEKAEELDPTYTIFVLSSEDLGSNGTLTSLRVRGSCVNYTAVEAVLPSNGLDSLEIYADTLDMSNATKLPDSRSITIHANVVRGNAGDREQVVRYRSSLFAVVGYPQILDDDSFGVPGTAESLTAQPPSWNLTFGYMDAFNSLSFATGFQLPELRSVKVFWSNYPGGFDGIVDVNEIAAYIFPRDVVGLGKSLAVSCNDTSFVSPNYTVGLEIPLYCYRQYDFDSSAIALYVFDWAATVPPSVPYLNNSIPYYNASEAVWTIQATTRFPSSDQFKLHVASEVPPGVTYLPTRRFRAPLTYGAVEPLTGSPYYDTPSSTVWCYWNTLQRLANATDFYNLSTQIVLYSFFCRPSFQGPLYKRYTINFTSPSEPIDVDGGWLAPTPPNTPDADVSRLLLSCWTSNFLLPPRDVTFEYRLRILIDFLAAPSPSSILGALFAEATKLLTDVNTFFPRQQVSVTKLSYLIYTRVLVQYTEYYTALSNAVLDAVNLGAASSQRLLSAQTALVAANNAVISAKTAWEALLGTVTSAAAAKDQINDVIDEKKDLFEEGKKKFQDAEAGNISKDVLLDFANLVGAILASIGAARRSRVVGASDQNRIADTITATRYLIESIGKITDLALVINTAILGATANLDWLVTMGTFAEVNGITYDAQDLLALLETNVNLDQPNLVPDDLKRNISESTFAYDVGAIDTTLQAMQNAYDGADALFAPAIALGSADEMVAGYKQVQQAGIAALKLGVQYYEALSKAVIAGVQYLTAEQYAKDTQNLLNELNRDNQNINELNFLLFLQTYSAKTTLLTLLNDACDAYFYASLTPCPVDPDVRSGRDELTLVDTIETLAQEFLEQNGANSRPQPIEVELVFDANSTEIEFLRSSGTLTVNVGLDNANFSAYYGVGIDLVQVTFDNLVVEPPLGQVQVDVLSSSFSQNRDERGKVFSFRGAAATVSQFYVPGLNNEIVIPAAIYPGDELVYFKPSAFQVWELKVNDTTVDVVGRVNTSQVTAAYVLFKGRGYFFNYLESAIPLCASTNTTSTTIKELTTRDCIYEDGGNHGGSWRQRKKRCVKRVNELLKTGSEVCDLNGHMCGIMGVEVSDSDCTTMS